MSAAAPDGRRLVLVGASHARLPIEARERIHLGPATATQLALELSGKDAEVVCLSTCNRTEIYVAHRDVSTARARARHTLTRLAGDAGSAVNAALLVLVDDDAALHLFKVAAGLDSVVTGETQILGQVREAYTGARDAGATGPLLDRLFAHALRTGKRTRTETGIAERSASAPGVAADLAERLLDGLDGAHALVVGSGQMAGLAAAALHEKGAEIAVAGRTPDRVQRLARLSQGRAVPLESLRGQLASADVLVSATCAPGFVVSASDVGRRERPLIVFDLAVPRDVDPHVRSLPNCALFDIDDLGAVAREAAPSDAREIARAESIVTEESERFARWRSSLAAGPSIKLLRGHAETIRRATLERHRTRLESLSPHEQRFVETLTVQLVGALIHEPTVELRRAAEAA
jgi:glutamyl-tRNA reductase